MVKISVKGFTHFKKFTFKIKGFVYGLTLRINVSMRIIFKLNFMIKF
jgi:hypothetical protein